MFYREIIAVCSQIHTKHINSLSGQSVELWMINLVVHIVTTGLYGVNSQLYYRTHIYIYLIYCWNMRMGRWRGHVNVRASSRRTEWQSAHTGSVICTRLPSTQNSAPLYNGTTDAALRHTHHSVQHTWTESPLAFWQHSTWRHRCPGRASDIAEPGAMVFYFGSQQLLN